MQSASLRRNRQVRYTPRASPRASKPGPRLALEAGTRRVNHRLASGCIFTRRTVLLDKNAAVLKESRGVEAFETYRVYRISRMSFSLVLDAASILSIYVSVIFWISSCAFLSSSSVIFLSLNNFFTASL